ncbi:MAG: gamma-glutamylcyclotransferase [Motiliproteus sp.]|nr:gamma-glutamylcyclotransferase [Motiliproteus sp.]MCW9051717.1 gamma-glutamylcyclotransferase [Motiliproteus sp.]
MRTVIENTDIYLAYGSNLHPHRLLQRLPGSELIGTLSIPGFTLRFHKRGQDGSGKCNLIPAAWSCSYGALYRLSVEHWPILDELEGGYRRTELLLEFRGQTLPAFTYLAEPELVDDAIKPFDWYLQLVRCGVDYLQLPLPNGLDLDQIPTIEDEDSKRYQHNQQLVSELKGYKEPVATLTRGSLIGVTGG